MSIPVNYFTSLQKFNSTGKDTACILEYIVDAYLQTLE